MESMRYNTSYRQTAAIVNRLLEGIGAIREDAKGLLVTSSFLLKRANKLGCTMSDSWENKRSWSASSLTDFRQCRIGIQ